MMFHQQLVGRLKERAALGEGPIELRCGPHLLERMRDNASVLEPGDVYLVVAAAECVDCNDPESGGLDATRIAESIVGKRCPICRLVHQDVERARPCADVIARAARGEEPNG